jgi:hypothetical protein
MQAAPFSRLWNPPQRRETRNGGEKPLTPWPFASPFDRQRRAVFVIETYGAAELMNRWKLASGGKDVTPDIEHRLMGDGAILQREHAPRIIERV